MDGLLSASGRTGDELGLSLLGNSSFWPPKWGLSISLMKKLVTRMGGGATGFICTNLHNIIKKYFSEKTKMINYLNLDLIFFNIILIFADLK